MVACNLCSNNTVYICRYQLLVPTADDCLATYALDAPKVILLSIHSNRYKLRESKKLDANV